MVTLSIALATTIDAGHAAAGTVIHRQRAQLRIEFPGRVPRRLEGGLHVENHGTTGVRRARLTASAAGDEKKSLLSQIPLFTAAGAEGGELVLLSQERHTPSDVHQLARKFKGQALVAVAQSDATHELVWIEVQRFDDHPLWFSAHVRDSEEGVFGGLHQRLTFRPTEEKVPGRILARLLMETRPLALEDAERDALVKLVSESPNQHHWSLGTTGIQAGLDASDRFTGAATPQRFYVGIMLAHDVPRRFLVNTGAVEVKLTIFGSQ
jgi:hypothetical protein